MTYPWGHSFSITTHPGVVSGRRLRPVWRGGQHRQLHILQLRGHVLLLRRGTHGRFDEVECDSVTPTHRHRVDGSGGLHDRGVVAQQHGVLSAAMRGGERFATIAVAVGPNGEAVAEYDRQRLDLVGGWM